MARIYGWKRFAHVEGFHGQLVSRFQLNKGKRWIRRKEQLETETAVVFSILHALAMEQRRRAAKSSTPGARASTSQRAKAATGPPLAQAA